MQKLCAGTSSQSTSSCSSGSETTARPPRASDQPLLNRRGEQLVDRVYPLDTAIVDGRGRLKIGDAFWVAEGPDLPQGVRVRITAVRGLSLQVHAVD